MNIRFHFVCYLSVASLLFSVGACLCCTANGMVIPGETIEIEPEKIAFDPLVEFFKPPVASNDKFKTSDEGLEILQFADRKGRRPWTAGFRTGLMFGGDFEVALDLECKIEEPKGGWGQGIVLIVGFRDASQTEIKLGRFAMQGQGQVSQVELSGRKVKSPIFKRKGFPIESGRLIIAREGSKCVFSIDTGDREFEIERLDCPTEDAAYVKVVCTRQDKDNTEARYLLKKLVITADRFSSLDMGMTSWFSWWRLAVGVQVGGLVGLFYWYWLYSGTS